MSERSLSGRCLCGRVRFRLDPPIRPVIMCHCTECRRWSGHAVAATAVLTDRLVVEDEDGLAWYRSSPAATRGFCRECGSSLFWRADGERLTSVMAGALDTPTGLALQSHIYTAEAADYGAVPADAPHHAGDEPSSWDPAAGA